MTIRHFAREIHIAIHQQIAFTRTILHIMIKAERHAAAPSTQGDHRIACSTCEGRIHSRQNRLIRIIRIYIRIMLTNKLTRSRMIGIHLIDIRALRISRETHISHKYDM